MTLLVLSGSDVRTLLTYRECARVMREALTQLADGGIQQPLRTVVRPAGAAGFMALMPSYAPAAGYGLKAICITPGNPARGLDSHQGGVMLFAADTGEPLALVNASVLTEIRTAAVSAVATDLLARPDATEVAIIGTGVQGQAHARALAATKARTDAPLTGIRLTGRDGGRCVKVAAALTAELGLPVTACASPQEAVQGAGIVVTATSSPRPVLRREWLAPGTHINAVGAGVPREREIDAATMADATLFVDSRESLVHEAGDYLLAVKDGAALAEAPAELGELLTGTALGRQHDAEITLFESLGLAAEDLMAASYVYEQAKRRGAGVSVNFAGA
jgi:ornithine cyclodeaminase/alanine dehydrogenase-like protein (mu-crystallin family)